MFILPSHCQLLSVTPALPFDHQLQNIYTCHICFKQNFLKKIKLNGGMIFIQNLIVVSVLSTIQL